MRFLQFGNTDNKTTVAVNPAMIVSIEAAEPDKVSSWIHVQTTAARYEKVKLIDPPGGDEGLASVLKAIASFD